MVSIILCIFKAIFNFHHVKRRQNYCINFRVMAHLPRCKIWLKNEHSVVLSIYKWWSFRLVFSCKKKKKRNIFRWNYWTLGGVCATLFSNILFWGLILHYLAMFLSESWCCKKLHLLSLSPLQHFSCFGFFRSNEKRFYVNFLSLASKDIFLISIIACNGALNTFLSFIIANGKILCVDFRHEQFRCQNDLTSVRFLIFETFIELCRSQRSCIYNNLKKLSFTYLCILMQLSLSTWTTSSWALLLFFLPVFKSAIIEKSPTQKFIDRCEA